MKVAMLVAALYETVPAMLVAPAVSVKVEVVMLAGDIALLKVAVTLVPKSTLVALQAGPVAVTLGAMRAGSGGSNLQSPQQPVRKNTTIKDVRRSRKFVLRLGICVRDSFSDMVLIRLSFSNQVTLLSEVELIAVFIYCSNSSEEYGLFC